MYFQQFLNIYFVAIITLKILIKFRWSFRKPDAYKNIDGSSINSK